MKTTVNAVINLHKILVSPIVLCLMWYYDNWSPAAFLYLGLHGTYTLLWLIKQNLYPDKRFEQQLPLKVGLLTPFLPLAGYYLAPYLLISQHTIVPAWVYAVALLVYTLGIFLHYVSDAQKHYTLNLKKGLIKDGLFRYTRNPNYLGEILIYGAFALVSWHWQPLLILGSWVVYFFVNMTKKDRSMARHEGFAAYRKKTGKLLPKLF
ncbi:DUF1295 domain-containing protein [Flavobacterium subsaxonicum]|uniref:Uncharacterized protein n=1 Tax=Flavobacterium subsaxonicum WB 4.1-42 = DSM 21790 TaxID=1121898 RepID=A0A0A2MYB9_9FLAO|nr:DUF1295 domain-containing protein [Flavobacterium subsaxonicum]KGO93195.1 hypothetical protein Q766_07760 [Flavobacterium subsaxonicum WB 4.1-42 = DSM 21790]